MGRIILVIFLAGLLFFVGKSIGDPNKYSTYGDTGLPRNCRAIIAVNIKGWEEGYYTADEALGSINRNCGLDGYSWGLK